MLNEAQTSLYSGSITEPSGLASPGLSGGAGVGGGEGERERERMNSMIQLLDYQMLGKQSCHMVS